MGSCQCDMLRRKSKDEHEKSLNNELKKQYKGIESETEEANEPLATAQTANEQTPGEENETKYEISVAEFDANNHDSPSIVSQTEEEQDEEKEKENIISKLNIITDDKSEHAMHDTLYIPPMDTAHSNSSDDVTPMSNAKLTPFTSKEAWLYKSKSTNSMTLSEMQQEIESLSRRGSEQEQESLPRRGTHLLDAQSIGWTQEDLEESEHLMGQQMEYLKQQVAGNRNAEGEQYQVGVVMVDDESEEEDISDLSDARRDE